MANTSFLARYPAHGAIGHARRTLKPSRLRPLTNLRWLPSVVLLACMAIAWTGCGTRPASASATPRAATSPTSSPAPAPVQVELALQQQGSVNGHTLKLTATATITNHAPQKIGILSRDHVPYPSIFYTVTSQYGTKLWDNLSHDNGGFNQISDTATIPPAGSFTYTSTLDLSATGGFLPGLGCLVAATVTWHTGTLPPNGGVPAQTWTATGQANITVQ